MGVSHAQKLCQNDNPLGADNDADANALISSYKCSLAGVTRVQGGMNWWWAPSSFLLVVFGDIDLMHKRYNETQWACIYEMPLKVSG